MRLLLDTHYLIWLANAPEMLIDRERELLKREDVAIVTSIISLWEIRIKWQTFRPDGSRKGDISPNAAATLIDANGWSIAGLDTGDILERLATASPNRDPYDEMMLVHAQRLDARLLTRDRALNTHPLAYRFE